MAFYSSTVFYQHTTRVINSLLIGIRDKQPSVREVCAMALASAFAVTATREGIGRRRQKGVTEPSVPNSSITKHIPSITGMMYHNKHQSVQPANYARSNDPNVTESTKNTSGGDGVHELYNNCIMNTLRGSDESLPSSHIDNRKWAHDRLLLWKSDIGCRMRMNEKNRDHVLYPKRQPTVTTDIEPRHNVI